MHTALRIDMYIVYIHIHICSKQLNNNIIQVSLFFVHTLQNDIWLWYRCNLGFCLCKLQSGVRLRWLTDKSCGQKLKIKVQFPLSQLLRVLLEIRLFLVKSCEPSTWTTFEKMSSLTCSNFECQTFKRWIYIGPHAQVPSPITTNQCHFNHTAAQRCIVRCGCCYPFFPLQWLVFLLRIKFTSVQWQKVLYLSKYLTLGFKVQQILQKNTYPGDNQCLLMNLNFNHVVLSAELGTTKTDWTIYPVHQTNGTWRLSLHNNSRVHVGQVLFSRSIHWLNQKLAKVSRLKSASLFSRVLKSNNLWQHIISLLSVSLSLSLSFHALFHLHIQDWAFSETCTCLEFQPGALRRENFLHSMPSCMHGHHCMAMPKCSHVMD